MEYLDSLARWLDVLIETRNDDESGFNLSGLSSDDLSRIALDIDGMSEAGGNLREALVSLIEASPSGDALETQLVDAEVHLDHALWHWRSLTALLRQRDLWPDDDSP